MFDESVNHKGCSLLGSQSVLRHEVERSSVSANERGFAVLREMVEAHHVDEREGFFVVSSECTRRAALML